MKGLGRGPIEVADDDQDDGRPLREHHSHAGHGCRTTGKLRSPGNADGAGAGGLLPVATLPALRSQPSDLAQSRPIRLVGRPRVHAGVRHAPPDRSPRGQPKVRNPRTAVGDTGGHQALPAARQQVSRAPGVSLDVGRRDDHRAVGTGRGDERRDGHRRAMVGELLQPAGVRAVRLRRLRAVRRRLHDGRDLRRGRLAGRAPQAREPVLDLRQQPHHHRGQHRVGLQR